MRSNMMAAIAMTLMEQNLPGLTREFSRRGGYAPVQKKTPEQNALALSKAEEKRQRRKQKRQQK